VTCYNNDIIEALLPGITMMVYAVSL